MSRLVVVSNRVADLESGAQSGGLAVAVSSMLEETGGLWFGWDGNIVDDDADRAPNIVRHNNATVATIPLSRNEYDNYYLGYSNKVLWPSFHYRLGLLDYESVVHRRLPARQRHDRRSPGEVDHAVRTWCGSMTIT